MNILNSVENMFKQKGVKYLKSNNSNANILNVLYQGIKNKKNRINIYMDIDEDLQIIKFSFTEKMNNTYKISDIAPELLDINSSITFGNLSKRRDSEAIEYRIDYQINNNSFSFGDYNKNIIRCINVYEKLKEDKII